MQYLIPREALDKLEELQMSKARVTKYIKRIPKPSGKGYIYFYNKEQVSKFYGAVASMATFFKTKGLNGISKVLFGLFHKNKTDLKGMSVHAFFDYAFEYFQNKEKWDSKFNKQKSEKKESEKPKEEKEEKEKAESNPSKPANGFNAAIMRKVAQILNGTAGVKLVKDETPQVAGRVQREQKGLVKDETPQVAGRVQREQKTVTANSLLSTDTKGFNAAKAESGGEIRQDAGKAKKYADAVFSELDKKGIKELPEKLYSKLEQENAHLLNTVLSLAGYFGKDRQEKEIKQCNELNAKGYEHASFPFSAIGNKMPQQSGESKDNFETMPEIESGESKLKKMKEALGDKLVIGHIGDKTEPSKEFADAHMKDVETGNNILGDMNLNGENAEKAHTLLEKMHFDKKMPPEDRKQILEAIKELAKKDSEDDGTMNNNFEKHYKKLSKSDLPEKIFVMKSKNKEEYKELVDTSKVKSVFSLAGKTFFVSKNSYGQWAATETGSGRAMGSADTLDKLQKKVKSTFENIGKKNFVMVIDGTIEKEKNIPFKESEKKAEPEDNKVDNEPEKEKLNKDDIPKVDLKDIPEIGKTAGGKKYIDFMLNDTLESYNNMVKNYPNDPRVPKKEDFFNSAMEKKLKYLGQLQKMIDDKNEKELINSLHTGNKMSKKMFSDYTGIKLGSTDRDTFKAIKDFCSDKEKKTEPEKEKSDSTSNEMSSEDKEKIKSLEERIKKINNSGANVPPPIKIETTKTLTKKIREIESKYKTDDDKRGFSDFELKRMKESYSKNSLEEMKELLKNGKHPDSEENGKGHALYPSVKQALKELIAEKEAKAEPENKNSKKRQEELDKLKKNIANDSFDELIQRIKIYNKDTQLSKDHESLDMMRDALKDKIKKEGRDEFGNLPKVKTESKGEKLRKDDSEDGLQKRYDYAKKTMENIEENGLYGVREKKKNESREEYAKYLEKAKKDTIEEFKEDGLGDEMQEVVDNIDEYLKSVKDFNVSKEELLGDKMFKAARPPIILEVMTKGKKAAVGDIRTYKNGKKYKKIDTHKWEEVTEGKNGENQKPEETKEEKKPDEKKKENPLKDEKSRGKIKDALKSFLTVVADTLSGKDAVDKATGHVERVGEGLENDARNKKKIAKPEPDKDKDSKEKKRKEIENKKPEPKKDGGK